MEFEYELLDTGLMLEVEYSASFLKPDGYPVIDAAWLYVDNRPVDIFDMLNGAVQDKIQEIANAKCRDYYREASICAAEEAYDRAREDALIGEK